MASSSQPCQKCVAHTKRIIEIFGLQHLRWKKAASKQTKLNI